MPSDEIVAIEAAIDYRFSDTGLLLTALTHASYVAEHDGAESYERLEFLGDAVLELVTTDMIYHAMHDAPEGRMTRLRASLVDERTLARVAEAWEIAPALRLGVGEDRSGGRSRTSILSDVVEAVIAAVYLDGGLEPAAALVTRSWSDRLDERLARDHVMDPRSTLQERLAQRGETVRFDYRRSGPDHDVTFEATAIVGDRTVGTGSGGSKKSAAIDAARDALERWSD
jgi:ribonuclease-3